MDFNPTMTSMQSAQTAAQVDAFNKTLAVNGRTATQSLGKDDFLKLLITQLANQDPTTPMENTEFIAQMAQFSSLEQMTNMSVAFESLSSMLSRSEAVSALGRTVEIQAGENVERGVVEAVMPGDEVQIVVNGKIHGMSDVKKIF